MRVKVAVTVVSAVMGRTQLPLPEQPPPDQPVNVEPPAGDAVNVTTVALENVSVQVTPQAIPEGALVTVPAPVPALTTVKVRSGMRVKVAVTVVSAVMGRTQLPLPEQPPPDQPVNVEPPAGDAVNVTTVALENVSVQVTPQAIPEGALVTVPAPVPALTTVKVRSGMRVKVAVTVVSAVMGRTQLPLPEQPPPDQPVNVEPPAGDAVNVTTVALENVSVQVTPQAIPEGALVTVPAPVPALTTVKVRSGMRVKVAVTVVSAVMGRTQLPLPEQPPPDQPVNVEPPAGDAVNVTTVALENVSVQVTPQAIPEGALVTVPAPVPALTTVKVRRNEGEGCGHGGVRSHGEDTTPTTGTAPSGPAGKRRTPSR